MKKLLIGTSALVAAGLLSSAAFAQAESSLKVSAYYNTGIGFVSEDDGVGEAGNGDRNHAVMIDSEVHFTGLATLDNGMEVGLTVELESGGSGTGTIDESYMYIENDQVWGRLEFGDRDGAGNKMFVLGPVVNGTTITGLSTFNWRNAPANNNAPGIYFPHFGDNTKVTYYTPRFSGFQFGASYTPELAGDQRALGTDNTAGSTDQQTQLGLNWNGTLGDASVRAAAGYSKSQGEAANTNDAKQWSAGVQISMMGWSFGGGYQKADTQAGAASTNVQRDEIAYRLAATYKIGVWTAGIEYFKGEEEDDATGEDELTVWSLQVNRSIAPGLSVGFGVRTWDWEDDDNLAADEHDATDYFITTGVRF